MRMPRFLPGQGRVKSPAKGPAAKRKGRSFWKELPVLIVVALLLTLVIKTYLIQAFYIPSGSMQNTLAIGDRVLVNKVVYDVRSIHRGDIVVFSGDGSVESRHPAREQQLRRPVRRERGLDVRFRPGPERLHQAGHRRPGEKRRVL